MHASAVAVDRTAILLRGPSGAGKSDLAFRMIGEGAMLIADDYVALGAESGRLVCSAPERLRGLIELRGIGLMRMPTLASAPVGLVVDLVPRAAVERLPEPAHETILGLDLPLLRLHAFDHSTPAKLRLAVRTLQQDETDRRRHG
ncbi:MAG: HPr kinase/phosphatase C-terminal domain-containing protein [Rhodothalassiaceae bacterium]